MSFHTISVTGEAWARALVMPSQVLLYGGFGFTVFRTIQGKSDLELPFERLVIGYLALVYYPQAADFLLSTSEKLTDTIGKLGDRTDLKQFILESIKTAANQPVSYGPSQGRAVDTNIPALISQAFRTGIWGILTAIVDAVFLIAFFLLDSARDVLWAILMFLFPLSCGLYPISPKLFGNLSLYAVELALWTPMLAMVEVMTSMVARKHVANNSSLGLSLIAVEIVAIGLILSIPKITHQFLSGAFAGDFESQVKMMGLWRKAGNLARNFTKTGGTAGAMLLGFAFMSAAAIADVQTIKVYPGYHKRIECVGRLYVSSIGNDSLIRLEALPKEVGCGVILKPLQKVGRTNLILETSSGSSQSIVVIDPSTTPSSADLNTKLDPDETKSFEVQRK